MFVSKRHLSRRTFLRGAGVTMALPFLESMVPAQTQLSKTAANPKTRLGCTVWWPILFASTWSMLMPPFSSAPF